MMCPTNVVSVCQQEACMETSSHFCALLSRNQWEPFARLSQYQFGGVAILSLTNCRSSIKYMQLATELKRKNARKPIYPLGPEPTRESRLKGSGGLNADTAHTSRTDGVHASLKEADDPGECSPARVSS